MFTGFIFDLEGTVYLNDQLIAGADRVIQLIRKKGRKVFFLSPPSLETQKDCAEKLTRLGIPTHPEEVIPSTLTLQRTLKEVGVRPEDCILIGDSLETEIKIGREAGMATGIVLTGVTDEGALQDIKHSPDQPDFVFQSIGEIENLLVG